MPVRILDFRFWILDSNPKSQIQNPKLNCPMPHILKVSKVKKEDRHKLGMVLLEVGNLMIKP
jgi:hypothetical protein